MSRPKFIPKPGQVDYTNIRYAPTVNIVVTYQGKIFCVKRSPEMRLYPNHWDWICGFLDDSKSIEEKAREELQEELGLGEEGIESLTRGLPWIDEAPEYNKTWLIIPVLAKVQTDSFTLNWEASEGSWFTPKELRQLKVPPGSLKTAAEFFLELQSTQIASMKKGIDYIGVSAGAMVFNNKDELFLSKRSQNCKNERGHWETPGGSAEFGETLEQAVRREMIEEYGAEVEIIEQFPAADHLIPAEGQHWVATTFLARFKAGQTPKIMEPDKCDEIGWFALDKLPQPLSLITQADLKEYAKRNKFKAK